MEMTRMVLVLLVVMVASFCGLAMIVSAEEETQIHSRVIELTEANFDELTKSGTWLLEFYAPWCGHCKKLAPVFEEVAEEVHGKMFLAKIDCTAEKGLQKRFEVNSFPTLIFLRDGETRHYNGDREKEALLDFASAVTAPAVSSITSPSNLNDFSMKYSVNFIYCGDQADNARAYNNAARKYQGLHAFLQSKSPEVMLAACGGKSERVAVLTEGMSDAFLDGPFTKSSLDAFIDKHRFPLITQVTSYNFRDLTTAGKLLIFSVTNPADQRKTSMYLDFLRPLAKRYLGKYIFANIDGIKFEGYVSQFGLTPERFPICFAFDYANEQYYPPEQGKPVNSRKSIEEFLEAVYEGRIQPRGLGAWWSPARFLRWFEKWLGQFTDTQLAIGSVVVVVVLMALIFWLFCTGTDVEDLPGTEEPSPADGQNQKNKSQKKTPKKTTAKIEEDKED